MNITGDVTVAYLDIFLHYVWVMGLMMEQLKFHVTLWEKILQFVSYLANLCSIIIPELPPKGAL